MSVVPDGWTGVTLDQLVDFNPRHDPARMSATVSFVPMTAVCAESGTIEGAVDRALSEVWKGFTHFADNDVIFAKITPCMENGKIAVARGLSNGLACGSTEFHVLRSKGAVLPEFLWRFLRQSAYRKSAEGAMTGAVGQRRVPTDFLRASQLSLPPLAEQRRILAKLDTLTACTARARADLDRIPALTARYKQAALTAFLSPVANSTKTIPLKAMLAELTSGSRDWAQYYDRGDAVFVLAGNVRPMRFDRTPKRFVDPPRSGADARRSKIVMGDLLLTIVGAGTGDLCAVPEIEGDYFVCQSVALLRLREPRLAKFIEFWFQSESFGRGAMNEAMYGAARPHLGFDDIKNFSVPDIDLATALQTVDALDKAFGEIERLTVEAAAARKLLDRLDQAILAKAFRGELVPQNPADEPASILLDRIRAERGAAPVAGKRGRKPKAA